MLDQTLWTVSSLNGGTVAGIAFDRFENLTGQAATNDAFVFSGGGRVTGTIAGGAGGTDGFAVLVQVAGAPVLRAFHPTTADGGLTFQGTPVTYTGMDAYTPIGGTDADRVISGSIFDAVFEVADASTFGQLVVTFEGLELTSDGTSFVTSYTFARPTSTLTVTSGTGLDSATVANLSPAFGGAVIVYSAGVVTATLTANDDTVVVALDSEADDGAPIVDLTVNGLLRTFGVTGGGVGSLVIHGLGGDDDVTVADVLFAPIAVYGGDGDEDTVHGPDDGLIWTITAENAGSGGPFLRFESVENVVGGAGADGFQLNGPLTGTIGLDGGGGSDTLAGPNTVNIWVVSGVGAGTINADTTFASIERLVGGSNADRFDIGDAGQITGSIDGGTVDPAAPPVDELDFADAAAAVTVNLQAGTAGVVAAFANINNVVGRSGAGDTLVGPTALADQTVWTITAANAGTVDGVTFSGFENLTGQAATNDAFVFAGGSVSTIAGGAGALDGFAVLGGDGVLRAFQPAGPDSASAGAISFEGVTVTYTGMEHFDPVGGTAADRVISGSIFDRDATLTLAGTTLTLTFQGLTFGGASEFTFSEPSSSLWLVTGTGGDEITTTLNPSYALISYAGGTLTVALRNTATADSASIALAGVGSAAASVDGGVLLTLTVNGFTRSFGTLGQGVLVVDVDGRAGNDTFTVTEALPIEITFDGGTDSDTLRGPAAGMEWTIDGPDSGSAEGITSFTGVENLVGRDGVDRFEMEVGGSISGSIDGGGGSDELLGPDQLNDWLVSGADAGVLNGTTDFVNIERLTGGTGDDVFRIGTAGSVSGSIDGGIDVSLRPTSRPSTP